MKSPLLRRREGFTLIEIMIVLAIVGMLFSFVGPRLIKSWDDAQKKAARIQIASYQQSLEAYYLAHNMYPNTAQGLDALIHKPTVGKMPNNYPDGGYFGKKELAKDPWGNPYRYECDDYHDFKISSDGPDGEPGTADDIKGE